MFQTCNNVDLDVDILFVETKNFPILGGKVDQSPVVLGKAYQAG